MRRWRILSAAALSACFGLSGIHAHGADESASNLTIWIVRPASGAERALLRAAQDVENIKHYRETTAGNFGKSASDVGQTAGSYGKPASEEGRPASEAGQTASSYGQTASSLPSNVKSQTAGSYGQTAGSFGTSASDFTGAPRTANSAESTISRNAKGARWTDFLRSFLDEDHVETRVLEISELELRSRLEAAQGRSTFPDVLISDRMPEWWPQVAPQETVTRLANIPDVIAFPEETGAARPPQNNPYLSAYGMMRAPHPEAVREFLDWWFARRRFNASAGRQPSQPTAVETLAHDAVMTILNGGSINGASDPAMARFSGALTRAATLGESASHSAAEMKIDAAVVFAQANDRFAVVRLRAVCLSRSVYGEFSPLVLLRTDAHGEWHVLQVTLRMSAEDAQAASKLLAPYALDSKERISVSAPTLASPSDGDHWAAGSGLRLAWDAAAEDGLLLVEWQRGGEDHLASSIMLVSNLEGRERTEAAAPFANLTGPVRWRVWALGRGGVVQFSGWRTVYMR